MIKHTSQSVELATLPQVQQANRMGKNVLQCVSQNFWQTVCEVLLKFPKFATNLAISSSFRSCQSNRELGNEVVNFTPNFVGKLTSSLREKFAPFGEIVSEVPYTLWSRRLGLLVLKWVIKRCNWIFPDVIRHLPKNRIQFLLRWVFLG